MLRGLSSTPKVHPKDVKHDVIKASVQVKMKDGREFTISRRGHVISGIRGSSDPWIFDGLNKLLLYLDDVKGLIKVDSGERLATCEVETISPVTTETCWRTIRQFEEYKRAT